MKTPGWLKFSKKKVQRRFWTARLVFIAINAPFILFMQFFHNNWLVPYLVWMSWATWLSSELPSGPDA